MIDIQLSDFLNRELIIVLEHSTLRSVIDTMTKNKIDHVPIVDSDGNLKGIISKNDLYRRLLLISQNTTGKYYTEISLETILATEIMTPDPVQLLPDDTIAMAAEVLMQGDFHAVPIVAGGKVLGIVTSKDILEKISEPNNS